jgi:hypothetical protein
MNISEEVASPEMTIRISYLFVVKNADRHLLPEEVIDVEHARCCDESSTRVSVFYLPSRQLHTVPANASEVSLLGIVQRDTDELVRKYSVFSVTNEIHDWDSSFVLWPIIETGSSSAGLMSADVDFRVFWDYLVVEKANEQQFERIVQCAATTLARYRTLSLAIRAFEEQIDELVHRLSSDDVLGHSESEVQVERWSLMSDFVTVNPATSLKWGFEFKLLAETSEAWNLVGLEKTAQESERIASQLISELAIKRDKQFSLMLSQKSTEQTKATRRLGFVVGLLTLLQLPQSFVAICGTFTESLQWVALGSLGFSVTLGVWMYVQHRKSER